MAHALKAVPFILPAGIALVAAMLASLGFGSVPIPIPEVLRALLDPSAVEPGVRVIVRVIRMPRMIAAVSAGAALALSGLQMQTLFRNPLAGPFTLGISSGAGLGVAVVVLAAGTGGVLGTLAEGFGGYGPYALVVAATAGAAAVLLAILAVARRMAEITTILILGILFGYAANAITTALLQIAEPQQIQSYITWSFGSFAGVTWTQLGAFLPVAAVGILLSVRLMKPLNALLLGERYAETLGMSVRRNRYAIIVTTALLAGATTAFCGPIAFIGIAVPHLCRFALRSSDHRVLIPACAVTGALVAVLSDLISRLPGHDVTLPLNAVTAMLGAPVVVLVIVRRGRAHGRFSSGAVR